MRSRGGGIEKDTATTATADASPAGGGNVPRSPAPTRRRTTSPPRRRTPVPAGWSGSAPTRKTAPPASGGSLAPRTGSGSSRRIPNGPGAPNGAVSSPKANGRRSSAKGAAKNLSAPRPAPSSRAGGSDPQRAQRAQGLCALCVLCVSSKPLERKGSAPSA